MQTLARTNRSCGLLFSAGNVADIVCDQGFSGSILYLVGWF